MDDELTNPLSQQCHLHDLYRPMPDKYGQCWYCWKDSDKHNMMMPHFFGPDGMVDCPPNCPAR